MAAGRVGGRTTPHTPCQPSPPRLSTLPLALPLALVLVLAPALPLWRRTAPRPRPCLCSASRRGETSSARCGCADYCSRPCRPPTCSGCSCAIPTCTPPEPGARSPTWRPTAGPCARSAFRASTRSCTRSTKGPCPWPSCEWRTRLDLRAPSSTQRPAGGRSRSSRRLRLVSFRTRS